MSTTFTHSALGVLTGLLIMHTSIIQAGPSDRPNFGQDVQFLRQHTPVLVLSNRSGSAQVAVAPNWQGRVLTSTATGEDGMSFGWINRKLIASGKTLQHMNPYGGEDRIWLGPEGGQYSIFFAKGAPFDLAHWFTPAPFDTEPFAIVENAANHAEFESSFSVTNYSGTHFHVKIDRTVRLLSPKTAWRDLDLTPPAHVHFVAYQSENRLFNVGDHAWQKKTGLLSIWILGMYNPSPDTTIVIPLRPDPEHRLGKAVTDDYFGPVPKNRLVIRHNMVYFRGDGRHRSKIGINPRRCRPILGSYDAANHVLTLVQFSLPKGETNYVNSLWKLQDHPYGGDAANSYNDGPPSPGAKPLGPFFEMESSSPAAALAPGQSILHIHRTFHFQGEPSVLNSLAEAKLGVSLETITHALPPVSQ